MLNRMFGGKKCARLVVRRVKCPPADVSEQKMKKNFQKDNGGRAVADFWYNDRFWSVRVSLLSV